jgi:hypothetical protein
LYSFTNPPLVDVVVEYDYELFVNDASDKAAALEEIDYKMFLSVLNNSPWMLNNIPTSSCDEMLINVLNLDVLQPSGGRRLALSNDWSYFLGWKNDPADTFQDGSSCITDRAVDGFTCYPINGRITAQVPVDLELSPLAIQLQVMNQVKAGVDKDEFLSGKIGAVEFIGQTIDGKNEIDRDGLPTSSPERLDDGNRLLSAFGITAISAICATVLCVAMLIGMRYRRRSNERNFQKLQNEATMLGGNGSGDSQTPQMEQPRQVFTESSPDGVEIVDMNTCGSAFCGGGDDASTINNRERSGKKGFSIGSLMDGLRGGKDDLSYASGPSKGADDNDSALSVETEDYGNAIGSSSLSKPYVSNNRRFASEL